MTHETCSKCSTQSQIRKHGIIQTSPVVAIKRSKDPPTWLKVATTLEKKPPTTHHCSSKYSALYMKQIQTYSHIHICVINTIMAKEVFPWKPLMVYAEDRWFCISPSSSQGVSRIHLMGSRRKCQLPYKYCFQMKLHASSQLSELRSMLKHTAHRGGVVRGVSGSTL